MNKNRIGVGNQWGEKDWDDMDDTSEQDNWSANIPNRIKLNNVMVTPKVEFRDSHNRAIYTAYIDEIAINFIVVGEKEIVVIDDERVEEILSHKKFYTPLWNEDENGHIYAEIVYFNFQWRRPTIVGQDNLGRPIYKFQAEGDREETVHFVTDPTGQLRFVKITDGTLRELEMSKKDGQGRLILEA
ncbi:MAG: hypothetical protein ABIM99_05905 [Candidatus Dojkabacteria bacterium]